MFRRYLSLCTLNSNGACLVVASHSRAGGWGCAFVCCWYCPIHNSFETCERVIDWNSRSCFHETVHDSGMADWSQTSDRQCWGQVMKFNFYQRLALKSRRATGISHRHQPPASASTCTLWLKLPSILVDWAWIPRLDCSVSWKRRLNFPLVLSFVLNISVQDACSFWRDETGGALLRSALLPLDHERHE